LGSIRKLAGQSAIYGLSSIAGRFLNYLLVPLHTNIFTNPGDYGVVTEIYAYISFLIIIYTFGLETAYFNFSEKRAEEKHKVFGTSMSVLVLISALISGSIILFSSELASVIGYASTPEYFTWLALIIAFDALTALPFARLRQQQKAIRFAMIKIAGIAVNIFFNILFFLILPKYAPDSPWYDPTVGVGYVFIANLFASAFTFLMLLPAMRFRFADFDSRLLKEILIYSSPLLIAGLAGMVNETLDRIMIKYLIDDRAEAMTQLGIYGACYKLSILMTLFVQAYRYAAEPFFFSQFKSDDAKLTYARVMKLFVLVCGVIFLFIMMYMDIIRHFIGKTYWEGLGVVPVLLLANICLGIFYNLSMWYKLTGKTAFGAWFAIAGAIVTIMLNLILIPKMGYMGAAWTTLICYAFMMVASWITGQKHYKVPYETGRILAWVVSAVALWIATEFMLKAADFSLPVSLVIRTLILILYVVSIIRIEKIPLTPARKS
jgi:O-antigen/teichoic acid export membrane protein